MNKGMNAIFESRVPLAWVMLVFVVGCSEEASERPRQSADNPPLVTAPAPSEHAATAPIHTEAGGIPATYVPYYQDGSLARIAEERQASGETHPGQYEFHGARLTRYSGTSLQGQGPVELEFNLQGALIASRGASGSVSDDEVAAVRSRANLLRSHALAQKTTRTHVPN
jgi:hypothetical protein